MQIDNKTLLEIMIKNFDSINEQFKKIDQRLDNIETEIKDFRQEMKQEIKGLDGKIDIIYTKLSSDINDLKQTPKSKYAVVKED